MCHQKGMLAKWGWGFLGNSVRGPDLPRPRRNLDSLTATRTTLIIGILLELSLKDTDSYFAQHSPAKHSHTA